jgi:hypothetical protein
MNCTFVQYGQNMLSINEHVVCNIGQNKRFADNKGAIRSLISKDQIKEKRQKMDV